MRTLLTLISALLLAACGSGQTQNTVQTTSGPSYDGLTRLRFNQLAMQQNLPLFWEADRDEDGAVDPDELRSLLFYPTQGEWTDASGFSPAFDAAYQSMVQAEQAEAGQA